jgi:4-fold beta flower protein
MKLKLLFSALLMLTYALAGGQTLNNVPKITDLFSADEVKKSGLSKLNADEIAALNAAIVRIVLRINAANESSGTTDGSRSAAKGLEFYDSRGRAAAYIDEDDENLTLYLWDGKPVAYLDEDSVYGFNGKHLGWLKGSAIYHHDGNVVAAFPEVFRSPVSPAPVKSFKQFVPFKSFKEFKPFKPFFSQQWSEIPAKVFFLKGVN